jgi:alanyl-tRNA synthetase
MVPFKKYFTGEDQPPYPRITTAQRCLRISGKHNDLEEVGKSNRHHTFFKMLGNFSFGAYGREEAIGYAWDFLTKNLGISPKDLSVTYCPSDVETKSIWDRVGVQTEEDTENWWSMGEHTGPCGPCTEIYFRGLEVWNIVFMTHNYQDGKIEPLGYLNVDTGMGLERLLGVLEYKDSTWETSIFQPYYSLLSISSNTHRRILADHARAVGHMLQEGLVPGYRAQGSVMRKLIRRSLIICNLDDEIPSPEIFTKLCQLVSDSTDIIDNEIRDFQKVVDRGLPRLKRAIRKGDLSPFTVFKLYEAQGFPIEFSLEYLAKRGISVDTQAIKGLMDEHRSRSGKGG